MAPAQISAIEDRFCPRSTSFCLLIIKGAQGMLKGIKQMLSNVDDVPTQSLGLENKLLSIMYPKGHPGYKKPGHALPVQGQCQGIERAQPELLFPCWCLPVVAAWKCLFRCSMQTLPAQLPPSHASLGVPVLQLTRSPQTLEMGTAPSLPSPRFGFSPCPPQGSATQSISP